jgi:hypothetical protein
MLCFCFQLSFLLAMRLALHQGSLPRFSNQDNPAAFHPCRHVRSVGYFITNTETSLYFIIAHAETTTFLLAIKTVV